jgi:hypothetical protein
MNLIGVPEVFTLIIYSLCSTEMTIPLCLLSKRLVFIELSVPTQISPFLVSKIGVKA